MRTRMKIHHLQSMGKWEHPRKKWLRERIKTLKDSMLSAPIYTRDDGWYRETIGSKEDFNELDSLKKELESYG